jgi:hypothetical protein
MFVVPVPALAASASYLARHYQDLRAWRFPAPDFDTYKQCVLVARHRESPLPDNPHDQRRVERWASHLDPPGAASALSPRPPEPSVRWPSGVPSFRRTSWTRSTPSVSLRESTQLPRSFLNVTQEKSIETPPPIAPFSTPMRCGPSLDASASRLRMSHPLSCSRRSPSFAAPAAGKALGHVAVDRHLRSDPLRPSGVSRRDSCRLFVRSRPQRL